MDFAGSPAAERPVLADELRVRLRALRDPEGRPVVEDVIFRKDGETPKDSAPDLVVVWEEDAYLPAECFDDSGRVFVD